LSTPSIATEPPSEFGRHIKSISHHSSVFLFGTLFSAVAGYFFKIYLARVLGAEALGIYALGMTVVGLAGVVSAFGVPQAASRFVAVYNATGESRKLGRFLWSCALAMVVSNAIVGLLLLALGRWIASTIYHTPALSSYMLFFVLIMSTGALTTLLGQALAGFKDVAKRTVITNFVGQVLTMSFAIALLTAGFGLRGYLIAQVASGAIIVILLARATVKLSPAEARVPSIGWPPLEAEVVSFSMAFFGVQGLEFLLAQTDKVLLGVFLNVRVVGVYSIAATLIAFVPLALQSVNQIFSPMIAELHAQGQIDLLGRLFRSLAKWTLGLTLPLAAVMMLYSRRIMGLFGPDFEMGWPVLVVGTLGQLVNCATGSVGYLLLMSGYQKKMLRIQTVMAVVVVVMNLSLIPVIGILGAATAGALVNAITNIWYSAEVSQTLGIRHSAKKYLALVAPAISTFSIIWLVGVFAPGRWPALVIVITGLLAGYAAFLGVSLLFAMDDDDRVIEQAVRSKIWEAIGRKTLAQEMRAHD